MFLKGVREGSPSRKLAIILPANIDIIDENHKASGCFLEKAIAPEIKMKVLRIFVGTWYISLKDSQFNHFIALYTYPIKVAKTVSEES